MPHRSYFCKPASGALTMISQTSGLGEERLERPVADEVAVGPVGHDLGVDDVDVVQTTTVIVPPPGQLVVDERPQPRRAAVAAHVERQVLGPGLDAGLDGGERRPSLCRAPRRHRAHNSMGIHQSQEQSVVQVTIRTTR